MNKKNGSAIGVAVIVFWVMVFVLYGSESFQQENGGSYPGLSFAGVLLSIFFAAISFLLIARKNKDSKIGQWMTPLRTAWLAFIASLLTILILGLYVFM